MVEFQGLQVPTGLPEHRKTDLVCADSGASRPPIPFHSGHRFRLKSAGNSGPIRPPE